MNCESVRRLILPLIYGELSDPERQEIEGHVGACPACAESLEDVRRLHHLLAQRPTAEPSIRLLERCRQELATAIDRSTAPEPEPSWMTYARVRLRITPGWAAALVVAAFLAGRFTIGGGLAPLSSRDPDSAREETGSSVTHLDLLQSAPGADRISISYDTLRHTSVEGSPRDPRIRGLLVGTLRDSLNAGLRLEAIDALSGHADEREVRAALLRALRQDENAGARLKALDALARRAGQDPEVRAAVVRALVHDTNPGVRVRAIDVLGPARHPETLPVLRRLAKEDPNDYVRLRSAALVSDLAPTGGGER